MALAEAADVADVPDGMSVPEELARREDRLAAIAVAKAAIEAPASRSATRRPRPNTKRSCERARRRRNGRAASPAESRRRRPRRAPGPKDQVNLTDADSRIMPVAGGGFEQCYNAQAAVAAGSLLVVTADGRTTAMTASGAAVRSTSSAGRPGCHRSMAAQGHAA